MPGEVAVVCVECGVNFMRRRNQLKPSPNRFCSRSCRARFYFDPVKASMVGAERFRATFAKRFWARVARGAPGECWEWQGYRVPKGYGQLGFNGKTVLAHRAALALTDGDWDSLLFVCHSCDNPPCCNPAHLWRGSNQDNTNDRWEKGTGRVLKGEETGQAKLTLAQVNYVRASRKSGTELARELSVANSTIYNIRNRVKWKHVP